jgi:hypothetical protein
VPIACTSHTPIDVDLKRGRPDHPTLDEIEEIVRAIAAMWSQQEETALA